MNIMFPDKVRITPVVMNTVFNTEERGASFLSKANVEEEGKIRYNSNGEIIDPFIVIIFPYKTSVFRGYIVEIVKLCNDNPTSHEAIPRKVIQASRRINFGLKHIEVLV